MFDSAFIISLSPIEGAYQLPPVFNNLRSFQQPRAAFFLAVRGCLNVDFAVFLALDLDLVWAVSVLRLGCICIWHANDAIASPRFFLRTW